MARVYSRVCQISAVARRTNAYWSKTKEEGHDFEDTVPERDLMGIIKLIVEQGDSLFFMKLKRKK